MKIARLGLIFVAACVVGVLLMRAQPPTLCTLVNLSACPTSGGPPSYAGPPTYQTFLTGIASSMASALSYSAGLPQPRTILSAQLVPASVSFITSDPHTCPTSGTCVYDNTAVILGYDVSLQAASPSGSGLKSIDLNIWMGPIMESSQYTSLCASTGTCFTPSGSIATWYTANLTLYDSLISQIQTTYSGSKLRLHPMFSGDVVTVCGITFGSPTLSQLENCTGPVEAALAKRYHVDEMTLMHEPCGVMSLVLGTSPSCALSVSDYDALVTYLAGVVRPNSTYGSIKLGSGNLTSGESSYVTGCYTVLNAVNDYCAQDIYPTSNTSVYYSGILSGVATTAAAVHAATFQSGGPGEYDADESAFFRWEPSGGSEATSYAGCGWVGFLSDGQTERWFQDVPGTFGRAIRAATWSLFDSEPLIFVTSDSANSRCSNGADGYLPNVMTAAASSLISQHGLAYGRVALGWQTSMQGTAKMSPGKIQ